MALIDLRCKPSVQRQKEAVSRYYGTEANLDVCLTILNLPFAGSNLHVSFWPDASCSRCYATALSRVSQKVYIRACRGRMQPYFDFACPTAGISASAKLFQAPLSYGLLFAVARLLEQPHVRTRSTLRGHGGGLPCDDSSVLPATEYLSRLRLCHSCVVVAEAIKAS